MAPVRRQTMLFSATMTEEVKQLVSLSLKHPVRLAADAAATAPKELTQCIVRLKGGQAAAQKEAALLALAHRTFQSGRTIVFAKTKARAHRCGAKDSRGGVAAAAWWLLAGACWGLSGPAFMPARSLSPRTAHSPSSTPSRSPQAQDALRPGGPAPRGRAARRHDAGGTPGVPRALPQGQWRAASVGVSLQDSSVRFLAAMSAWALPASRTAALAQPSPAHTTRGALPISCRRPGRLSPPGLPRQWQKIKWRSPHSTPHPARPRNRRGRAPGARPANS